MELISRKSYPGRVNLFKYLKLKAIKRDLLGTAKTKNNEYEVWACEVDNKKYLIASALDEPHELITIQLDEGEIANAEIIINFVDYGMLEEFIDPFRNDDMEEFERFYQRFFGQKKDRKI